MIVAAFSSCSCMLREDKAAAASSSRPKRSLIKTKKKLTQKLILKQIIPLWTRNYEALQDKKKWIPKKKSKG